MVLSFLLLLGGVSNLKSQNLNKKIDLLNTEMDVFLLIGQSNMQGVAPIGSLDTIALNNVYLLNDKNKWEAARNLPDNGMNRYSTVKKKSIVLFGPAYTFGRKIEKYTDKTIGIVSNARGATRIEWWQKGFNGEPAYKGVSDFDLYEESVARVKAALAANPKATLKGILWHQGEADNAPDRSPLYMERLRKLVSDLRNEFGNPELPFIAGEVGTWNGRGANVNPVIREIKNTLPFTEWVSSEGYTSINLKKNDPHFDNLSQRSFGGRYADKAAGLIYNIKPKGVILFNAPDYTGRSVLLVEGLYSSLDLESMGIKNNEIASVRLDAGYKVALVAKSEKRDLVKSDPSLKSFVPEYVDVRKIRP